MGGHHLILGTLSDVITGEVLDDTLDERYRQKIAGLLVNHKGYLKSDIEPRRELRLQADDRRAVIKVDFIVRVADRAAMIFRGKFIAQGTVEEMQNTSDPAVRQFLEGNTSGPLTDD
jgi:ABC-type branched-subunit amino acid transport system ATPase component